MLKITLPLILALMFSIQTQATILTVSNAAGNPAQYATGSDAFNAATAGDTIYFQSTGKSYNSALTVSKKLTLIGPGKNPMGYNQSTTVFRSLRFISGSDGSAVIGLTFTSGIVIDASNILVSGCYAQIIHIPNSVSNIQIRDNVLVSSGNVNPYAFFGNIGMTNITITNNLVYSQMFNVYNATIKNNVFTRGNDLFKVCANNTLENNIFYGPYLRNCGNCTFNSNISFGNSNDSLPVNYTGSNNIISKDPQFTNAPLSYVPSQFYKYDFTLKSTSPAKNKGTDGKDMGLYGGTSASISGNANIPLVKRVNVENDIVPQGGKVKVNLISTKPE